MLLDAKGYHATADVRETRKLRTFSDEIAIGQPKRPCPRLMASKPYGLVEDLLNISKHSVETLGSPV